jgi:hypothetical protein
MNNSVRQKQIIAYNLRNIKLTATLEEEAALSKVVFNSPLTEVKGLGEGTIRTLAKIGITTTDELKAANLDEVFKTVYNPISRIQIKEFLSNKPSSILKDKETGELPEVPQGFYEGEELVATSEEVDEIIEAGEEKGILDRLLNK